MMSGLFFVVGCFSGGYMVGWAKSDYWKLGILVVGIIQLMFKGYPSFESTKMVSSWAGFDSLAVLLILLSIYLIVLMVSASGAIFKGNYFKVTYNVLLILLLLVLYLSFMTMNFLLFYFMFEASLLPTLVIIMGWGYQPERLQAGVYFMMYTLFMSLPLFLCLVYMDSGSISSWMWDSLSLGYMEWWGGLTSKFVMAWMLLAFLVKLPMFLMHLWLPKAHVEAPVSGSMILAGVLLKLGGYGVYRMLMKFYVLLHGLGSLVISISIVGVMWVGAVCCRLNDMKSIVAYSSVAHMGLALSGLLSGSIWGVVGAFILMVSHGIGSSGLFCFVNLMYERSGSRSFYMNSGVLTFIPVFSLFLFLLCCINISAPPTINFISEVSLIVSVVGYEWGVLVVVPMGVFMGVVFTFYLYSYSQHGKVFWNSEGLVSVNFLDYHQMVIHILPVVLLTYKVMIFTY